MKGDVLARYTTRLLAELPLDVVCPDMNGFGVEVVARLLAELPLSPLTDDPNEWRKQGDGLVNRRYPALRREADGVVIDSARGIAVQLPYLPERKA